MKVAVIGSRDFKDLRLLVQTLDEISNVTAIISGGADGADRLAEQYAKKRGIAITIYFPNWKKYGRSAGIKRNGSIIGECDLCVAFWDGKSRGTANSIKLAEKLGKELKIIRFN